MRFFCRLLLLFTFLFPLSLSAAEALPPLVPEGENFEDFPDWHIEKRTAYNSVAFSPDGKLLAAGADDNTVKLWDVGSRRLLHSFEGHASSVNSVSFSPDGETLASGSSDSTVKLWDVGSRRLLHSFDEHKSTINVVKFSPNGSLLASGSDDKAVKLIDVDNYRLIHSFDGHLGPVNAIDFSPDGKLLVSGGGWFRASDKNIRVWNIENLESSFILKGHKDSIDAVVFYNNGERLISSSADGSIKFWDVADHRVIDSIIVGPVNSISLSKDENLLVIGRGFPTAAMPKRLELWDVELRRLLHAVDFPYAVFSVDINGSQVALVKDGVSLWSLESKKILHDFSAEDKNNLFDLKLDENFVSADYYKRGNQVRLLWDIRDYKLVSSSFKKDVPIDHLSLNAKNNEFFNYLKVDLEKRCKLDFGKIEVFFIDEDRQRVFFGENNRVRMFSINSCSMKKICGSHDAEIKSIDVSSNGQLIASGSEKGVIKLWEVDSCRLLNVFNAHDTPVNSVRFGNNGGFLFSASSDLFIKVWDVHKFKLYKTLYGSEKVWISWDAEKKMFLRGDDGSLLLVRGENGDYQSALPKGVTEPTHVPFVLELPREPIQINAGKTTGFTINLRNTTDQVLPWVQAQAPPDSPFHVSSDQIYRHEPGQNETLTVQVSAKLPRQPQPRTDTLKLKLIIPGVYETTVDIPVEIKTPSLQLAAANLLEDGKTLSVRVENTGTQAIENIFFDLSLPGDNAPKLDIQNVREAIPAQGHIERAFVLPDDFKLDKDATVSLDVRNGALPFMQWDFPDQTVNFPRPPWQLYVALLFLLLAVSAAIFYFRRYRHPLVLELSDQPQALLRLPPEQLPEAQQRLTHTRRLAKVLSDAGVSSSTLQTAISFQQLSNSEQAALIAQRVGGVLQAPESVLDAASETVGGMDADSKRTGMYSQRVSDAVASARSTQLFTLNTPENFPLNVDKLLLFFANDAEAEDVFTQLKVHPDTRNRITLLFGKDTAYQRKLYNTARDPSNKWVAPQGTDITRLLLAPDAETVLAEILAGQLSLQQVSPYCVGGGVANESVFFGRRELINQIINRDPANYLVVGGRQVGKSTLLKAIERRYADNPQVRCHYLTLSSEVLVPRLAALLDLDDTEDAEALAAQLDQQIRASGKHYLFLIDEADRFIAHEQAQDYRILNVFRRLSEEDGCSFILAGFWQLYQHAVLDYQSPIRNFGELLSVGALEQQACIDLATQPMQTMNLSYANPTLVEELVKACGQRANLIAIVCQHIVRHLPAKQRQIEAGDVQAALHSDEVRRALSGWVIGEQPREQTYERMVVYATITREAFTTGDLLDLAEAQGINVDTQELDRTLARLELAFILKRDGNQWCYRVPLFVDYIRGDVPERKLTAEIQALRDEY